MSNSDIYRQRRSRRKLSKFRYLGPLVAALALSAAFIGYRLRAGNDSRYTAVEPSPDVECLQQVVIPDETPEIMVEYTGFTVSFNPVHHQPNYVVWELTGSEAEGDVPRNSNFRPDCDVLGCATLDDYRYSGYDRGHMAPAADMKWSAQAMADCHYLTNICPQDHNINGGRWSTLEKLSRQWADRDSSVIIICGPVLSDELISYIGDSQVSVPERFFKVIMSPFIDPPKAIGFIVPNHRTDDGIEAMAVSVNQVEEITGFDFFSSLPDDVEDVMEEKSNFREWNKRKRIKR